MAILFFVLIVRNVKKSKLRTDYALVWIIFSLVLIIIAVFPEIAYFFAKLIGVMSPANMVFAFIILLLIIMVYSLFARVSALEERVKNLIQHVAILEKENEDKEVKEQNK